jgi:DNA-binding transcriptional regulator YiaG
MQAPPEALTGHPNREGRHGLNNGNTEISGGLMTDQAEVLRAAREQLQVDSAELAEMLGVSLPTLRSWIAPTSSKMHRSMPRTAQLLLDRILAEAEKSDHRN